MFQIFTREIAKRDKKLCFWKTAQWATQFIMGLHKFLSGLAILKPGYKIRGLHLSHRGLAWSVIYVYMHNKKNSLKPAESLPSPLNSVL